MKAVEYRNTGTPEVLQLVERERPAVSAGEVRVRIAVAGVNPTDWKSRVGAGDGTLLTQPKVPGQDGAGFVDAVGAGVIGVAPGDRVWVWDAALRAGGGTAQEYVTLPSRQVVALPGAASFDLGATLGIPALTAHRALTAFEHASPQLAAGSLDGRTVLVAGGAGAVGHAAIELARWAGATVVATVSSAEKAQLAARAGAQHVVNYREADVEAAIRGIRPDGVDIIVEVNPLANLELDQSVIAPNGTIALYAADAGTVLPLPVRANMTKNVRYQFILTYTTTLAEKDTAVAAVRDAVAAGALHVGEAAGLPIIRFALERTADAHRAVEAGAVGKVLIDVGA
ncbi:MAG: NADPH:quinone reductase [Microbacteriaceae bacterium]|nr:MAG: NADPH:quinone reductase [Microbacteriaceae bacterium]